MINRTRPLYFPLHGELGFNTVAPQNSDYISASYPTLLPVPSGDHNGKLNSNGRWASYNDATHVRVQDWLDTTNTQTLALTRLTYVDGGNVLSTGAVVQSRGAYLFNGARFETDDAFLNPVGASIAGSPLVYASATVPGRIWVYTNEDGEVRIESVGPAVADAPAGDEMTLAGLQIDGLGVITDGSLVPTTLPLPAYQISVVAPQYVTGAIEIDGAGTMLMVTAGGTEGGDAGVRFDGGEGPAAEIFNDSPTDVALAVTNLNAGTAVSVLASSAGGAVLINAGTGRGVQCTTTGALAGIRVTASGAGRGIDVTRTSSGVGVYADTSGGSGYAIDAVGPSGGTSIHATTATGNAVQGIATGSGVGIQAQGGASAASLAVRAESTHDSAFAVQGLTTTTAAATSAGVLGSGRGDGVGVYGFAIGNGFGIVAQADSTTPTRSAFLMIPQDADPTTGVQGSMLFQSARGPTGKVRIYTTQWESVHSSAKGYVFDWGAVATGTLNNGVSANLSLAQISPEQVGDVLVEVAGHLSFALDDNTATISLVDVTAASTIASQTETASDPAGSATNHGVVQHSFVLRRVYTLPSAATRTFAVVISTTGSVTYAHVHCTVTGVR